MDEDYARSQVLENLILGTDTADEQILRRRARKWLAENNFDVEVLGDYPDAAGCIADHVGTLSPEEVQQQLRSRLDQAEIERLTRAKMSVG